VSRAYLNRAVRRDDAFRGLFSDDEYHDVAAFFAARPELRPTPLRSLSRIAGDLGIGSLLVKDETARFGVNAFKIAGVSYAVHKVGAAARRGGLVCATAGNHGRAVARVARENDLPCTVFVPVLRTTSAIEERTRTSRLAAMREDGARVIEVDGTYEAAVAQAAAFGDETGGTIVSDTSWDGYNQIPRWIMAGYTRLFDEASAQWDAPPTLVVIQGGVGGLVCAAAAWFASRFGARRPVLVACEPEQAACLLASAEAGRRVHINSSLETIMAGLRCAEPSPAAWPTIAAGIDAFVSIPDWIVERSLAALTEGAEPERILAGPSGACGVAALHTTAMRDVVRLDRSTRALAVITEGA
jgi:diaminopropionate ammonia-lyase